MCTLAQVVAARSMQGWLRRPRLDREGSSEEDAPPQHKAALHTNAPESDMGRKRPVQGES